MKLDTAERNALPAQDFAGPNRSFPDQNKSHAIQALRERKFAPNPSAIVAAVHRKFPQIGSAVNAEVQKRLSGGK